MFRIFKILFISCWILFLINVPHLAYSLNNTNLKDRIIANEEDILFSKQFVPDLFDLDDELNITYDFPRSQIYYSNLYDLKLYRPENIDVNFIKNTSKILLLDIPPPFIG